MKHLSYIRIVKCECMIQAFLTYMQYEKNRSSHTVLSYKTDLLEFQDFISGRPVQEATVQDVRGWVVSLMSAKVSPRSVNRKLSALRAFYGYLFRKGIVQENPMRKISALKTEKKLPTFFRQDSVEAASMPQGDDKTEFAAARDALIISMFYETGIRRAELIGLKAADVNLSSRTIKVLGKGNKERIIPIGEKISEEIDGYNKIKCKFVGKTEWFFCRDDGKPLYPMMVYRIVHELMARYSTLQKCSPHVLRHTFATALLNEGANINAVKELMGHANLAATQVYTHLTFEQLQKIYKLAHPRA